MASKKNAEKTAEKAPKVTKEPSAPKAKKEPSACQCFTEIAYYIGPDASKDYDGSEPDAEPVYGLCGATTSRFYAPGHDARLKSVLIKLHNAGMAYNKVEGGMLVAADPYLVATELGWASFLDKSKATHDAKVAARATRQEAAKARKTAAAEARKAKEDARNEAKAKAAEAKPKKRVKDADPAIPDASDVPVAGFHPVRVKVGRKVYDANIVAESVNEVTVSYKDGRGNARTAVVKRSDLVA